MKTGGWVDLPLKGRSDTSSLPTKKRRKLIFFFENPAGKGQKGKNLITIGITGVPRFIEKRAQFGYARKECLGEKKSR